MSSIIVANCVFDFMTGKEAIESFYKQQKVLHTSPDKSKDIRNSEFKNKDNAIRIHDIVVKDEYEAIRVALKEESFSNAIKSIIWPAHIAEITTTYIILTMFKK
jgi:hypothetical protein